MRMLPTRYMDPKPARTKKPASQIAHLTAPLKGLSLAIKLTPGDPQLAPILTNFVMEDDRIKARAGYVLHDFLPGGFPIETLVPWYGPVPKLAAASNGGLVELTSNTIKAGFTGNDWSWTAFSNLGQQKFTVMCNGHDGVWSWDGGTVADPAAVTVTSLSSTNPATCTVGGADIGKFHNGQSVLIAGATGGHAAANGLHYISSVGSPANTFTLTGIDLSAAGAPQTTGVTADPPGSFMKEIITAPPAEGWIVPDQINIVLAHMNRLFFADTANLAVYYLPLQQKSGELKVLPLNSLFQRGGSIRAVYSWTMEGGVGINDHLCIFSTNGELVIYQGTDPDTDFQLVGIFRFDSPMSKHSVINYGGDLYVLISTGLVPMSTMLKAESEQLGTQDRNVITFFREHAQALRDDPGWGVQMDPSSGRLIVNVPGGMPNLYSQMVRHMPAPRWGEWENVPARCWAWVYPDLYFGDDSGNVFRMSPDLLSDNGNPITVDVQLAWSTFKTASLKHFKMIKAYMITDGPVRPFIDVKTDYDNQPPVMQPEVTFGVNGASWDLADWDTSDWTTTPLPVAMWNGVGRLGRVGAPRLTASIKDCHFAITGFDVVFEVGTAV